MSASILIVEDEEPLQVLLSYNLEAEGYRPRTATSGEEVPLLITEERPDLIILDWMLPGISGIEVCRLLRARPETRDIPIVMPRCGTVLIRPSASSRGISSRMPPSGSCVSSTS